MTAPRVSIVLPTKDRTVELRRALLSVVNQTMRDLEVIVVDDGSAQPVDPLPWVGADPRVRVIRHETSKGVAAARNAAIDASRAEWIAFLDDDDFWFERKLEMQLSVAERTGAQFLFSSALVVNGAGRTVGRVMAPYLSDLRRQLLELNAVGGPSSVMVHREALRRAGPFDTELSVLADWDMWLKLSRFAKACSMRDITTAILDHQGSMQVTQAATVRQELEHMRVVHRDLVEELGRPLGSDSTEVWFAAKDWRAERTPARAINYFRGALRHHGCIGLARLAASRWVRRGTTPRWVRDAFQA